MSGFRPSNWKGNGPSRMISRISSTPTRPRAFALGCTPVLLMAEKSIYATAGTVTIKDMTHNFTQLDGTSTQYAQSIENAWVLSSRIAAVGGSLSFTGHSLGGGEAVCNALATGLPAIVFNPAGVADATKLAHGIPLSKDYSNQLITTIVSEKDPLTLFQDAASQSLLLQSAVPAAEGRRYYVHYEDHYLIAHSMTGIADSLRRLTPLR